MVATVFSPLIKDRMREREKYIRKCYQKELKPSSRESRWTAEQEPWAFLTQGFQKIGQTFSWCHSGPRSIRWGTGLADHTCHGNTKAREWSPGGIVPPQVLENKGAISKGFFFFPEEDPHKDEMIFGVFVPPVPEFALQAQAGALEPWSALPHSSSLSRAETGLPGFDGAPGSGQHWGARLSR